jgi:hypothetical protein
MTPFYLRNNLQFNKIYKGRLHDGRFIFFKFEVLPGEAYIVVSEWTEGRKEIICSTFSFDIYRGMGEPSFLEKGQEGLFEITERDRIKLALKGMYEAD